MFALNRAAPEWRFAFVLLFLLSACSTTSTISPTQAPTLENAGLPAASCTVVSQENANDSAAFPYPPISDTDWQRGPSNAQVNLIVYSDFQCETCAQLNNTLQELLFQYPDDLRLVFRHFPLIGTAEQPLHDKAALAMQASEAAGRQGKFWEMHDALFLQQAGWSALTPADFEDWLSLVAADLELDVDQFTTDLNSEELSQMAQVAWEDGQDLQLGGAPFLLIDGAPYSGPLDIYSLDIILQLEFLRQRQFSECPQMALESGAAYTATLHTAKGDIVIELFPDIAPMAVNSFIFLAQRDWFDNVTFHRVLPGFVAQAGDPTGTGYGGPGYAFAIEVDPGLTFDRAGLLAMANSGPNSNGSQFFITLGPAPHLDGGFTIFGEVIAGMDVVESLTPRDPSQSVGLPPGDLILDVTIEVH